MLPARRPKIICPMVLIAFFMTLTGCGNNNHDDIAYDALGASDATGVGAVPITKGYVYQIQDKLEADGKSTGLLNLGIPDADTDVIFHDESKVAEKDKPDLITIFAGANDIIDKRAASDFETDLNNMLGDLTEDTHAFIVIGTLPDISKSPRFQKNPDPNVTTAIVNEYNQAILRQAALFDIPVADLSHDAVDADVTAADGFHPNNDGYTIIANEFLKVIEPHFLSSTSNDNGGSAD